MVKTSQQTRNSKDLSQSNNRYLHTKKPQLTLKLRSCLMVKNSITSVKNNTVILSPLIFDVLEVLASAIKK